MYLFFLPNCPLTTIRSRFSVDEQQMYPQLRLVQFVVCSLTHTVSITYTTLRLESKPINLIQQNLIVLVLVALKAVFTFWTQSTVYKNDPDTKTLHNFMFSVSV